MASVIWNDKHQKWVLRVSINGQIKSFVSRRPGLAGKKDVLRRYREWEEFGGESRHKALFREAWSNYIKYESDRLGAKSESLKQHAKIGRLYLLPRLGAKRMINITQEDYQDVLRANPVSKRTKILSEKYLKTIRDTINSFLKYAVQNRYAEPLLGTLYIPKGHPTIGKEILQPDEIRELFLPSNLTYHKAFCFIAATGVRPGECLGLKWSDIKGELITIRRSVNTSGDITDGKNKNARRVIPIAGITKQILDIQRENTKHLKSEWIFCNHVGAVGNQHTMGNQFRELKKARGLHSTPYGLRHTFVSIMSAASMSEFMIKQIVGHSASMRTLDTYGHLVNGEMKKAAVLTDITFNAINDNTGDSVQ